MSNTNTEVWGNIELPGLSDEELFRKNWNQIGAVRDAVKRRNKTEWLEKNNERYQDLEYRKKHKEAINKGTAQSKTWKEANLKHIQNISKDLIRNEKIGKASKDRQSLPEVKAAISARGKAIWADSEYKKRRQEQSKARRRSVMTPKGQFDDVFLAAEAFGLKVITIYCNIRNKPKDWYYITKS